MTDMSTNTNHTNEVTMSTNTSTVEADTEAVLDAMIEAGFLPCVDVDDIGATVKTRTVVDWFAGRGYEAFRIDADGLTFTRVDYDDVEEWTGYNSATVLFTSFSGVTVTEASFQLTSARGFAMWVAAMAVA